MGYEARPLAQISERYLLPQIELQPCAERYVKYGSFFKMKALFPLFICCFNGCLPTYAPGIMFSRPPDFPSPVESEGNTAEFIGVQFDRSLTNHSGEANTLRKAHYFWINRGPFSTTGLSLSGYYGSYDVQEIVQYQGPKNYYGISPQLDFNLFFTKNNYRAGPGIFSALHTQNGEYSDFLVQAQRDSLIDIFRDSPNYFWQLSFYFLNEFSLSKSSKLTIKFELDNGHMFNYPSGYFSTSTALYYKWVGIWANLSHGDLGTFAVGTSIYIKLIGLFKKNHTSHNTRRLVTFAGSKDSKGLLTPPKFNLSQ